MDIATAIVINLNSRPDRLSSFRQRWAETSEAQRDVQRVEAVEDLILPARGCLKSHLKALEQPGPVLILEDDAAFSPDFTLDLDPPEDWQILWLGGQHYSEPIPVEGSETWCKPVQLMRTHGYIVRDPATILSLAREYNISRVDPYLSQLPVPQYALKRFTVGQAEGISDISGQRRDTTFWNDGVARFGDYYDSSTVNVDKAGTFVQMGVPQQPLKLKLPNGSWRLYAGGGQQPLKQKQADGTWRTLTTGGSVPQMGSVTGIFTVTGLGPQVGKTVTLSHVDYPISNRTTITDSTGRFTFSDVNPGIWWITVERWYPYYDHSTSVLVNGPMEVNMNMDRDMFSSTYQTGTPPYGYSLVSWIANDNWRATDIPGQEYSTQQYGGEAYVLQAYGISYQDRANTENINWVRELDRSAGWYTFPVQRAREVEAARIALDSRHSEIILLSVTLVVRMHGWSVIKNSAPGWLNYEAANVGLSTGTGNLVLLSEAPNSTTLEDQRYPDGPQLPYLRDKTFARETGTSIWSGNLNDLASDFTGTEIRRELVGAELNAEALVFHANVSDPPDPDPFASPVKTTENILRPTFFLQFDYIW